MINFFKLIRINQWTKNILLFFPLIFSHQISNQEDLILNSIIFISFSLCASASYIINDILDLEVDRKHPYKKFRPLASNKIKFSEAIIIMMLLIFLLKTLMI